MSFNIQIEHDVLGELKYARYQIKLQEQHIQSLKNLILYSAKEFKNLQLKLNNSSCLDQEKDNLNISIQKVLLEMEEIVDLSEA
jgi:hypothetical protein